MHQNWLSIVFPTVHAYALTFWVDQYTTLCNTWFNHSFPTKALYFAIGTIIQLDLSG